jgi:hypothetical protein
MRADAADDARTTPRSWIFDVDGCVVDSLLGSSLRPGARELLEQLRAAGHEVIWWSAGGEDHARGRAQRFGVDQLVSRFAEKDRRDADGRYEIHALSIDLEDAVFIDDRPEDLPVAAEVLAVAPYLIENPRDRGLATIAARAGFGP